MSQLFHAIEPWADVWATSLWRATWQGTIVLGLAWAVARWCTFLSPRVACWIWRLACIKLLVALFWIQPVAIPLLPARPLVVAALGASVPRSPAADTAGNAMLVEENVGAATVRTAALNLLLLVWLACLLFRAIIMARQWSSVRRLCHSASPAASQVLQRICRREADRLSLGRLPDLRLSQHADGPLLAGVRRPAIILPATAEDTFDESELRVMLAHELAHLKRRDLLWNWLPTVAGWLFCFHPLVWRLSRWWSEAQEAACDELLIQNNVARPAEYGRLLLRLSTHWPLGPCTSLAAAGVLGNYRNLERRLLAMAQVRQHSKQRMAIAAVLLSLVALGGTVPWRLVAQEVDPAEARSEGLNQLKQLGLGLLNYHDAQRSFPLPAIVDADGKPLLSWRVAILPYLDATDLYEQFHLDEAWDSPHNFALVAKMPDVYRCPNSAAADRGMTVYLAPRGKSTLFPGSGPVRLRDVTDGTSKTIAVVEADEKHAVPWTKPDDWALNPQDPKSGLGGHFKGNVILTLFCDGSAHALSNTLDDDTLRQLFTRNGREPVVIPDAK